LQILRRYRKPIFVLVGMLACAGVLYFALMLVLAQALSSFTGLASNSCESTEPPAVESLGRFKLPPSADNLWSWCWGMQGWFAYARFEILPEELNILVTNSLVELPLSSSQKPDDFDFPDENVESVTTYLYGKYESRQEEISQEILVDTSNPALYTVYISVLGG
jgi:hypothetical protein